MRYQTALWKQSLTDPIRDGLLRQGQAPDLDFVRNILPPTTGAPAFDQAVIEYSIARLITVPEVNTGDPFLDLSVKTGLAFIDATLVALWLSRIHFSPLMSHFRS